MNQKKMLYKSFKLTYVSLSVCLRVQCLSCPEFVVSRICRVQCLSVQDLSCLVFVCLLFVVSSVCPSEVGYSTSKRAQIFKLNLNVLQNSPTLWLMSASVRIHKKLPVFARNFDGGKKIVFHEGYEVSLHKERLSILHFIWLILLSFTNLFSFQLFKNFI